MIQGARNALTGGASHGAIAKAITVWTCVMLSIAFMKNVGLKNVDGVDYVWFAAAMAVAGSPSMVREWLHLNYAKPTGESAKEK